MENTYELTLVFPAGDSDLKDKTSKLVEDFVSKNKGEVNKRDSWGVRDLAYPIGKHTKGDYEHFVLTIDSSLQPKLDEQIRLTEGILRYLFISVS